MLPCLAAAQAQPQKLRVALIGFSTAELREPYEQKFIEELRERGYVEGKNLELMRRYADGQPARVHQIASELAGLKLDAVVTTCTPTTAVIHKSAEATPLVMAGVSDPVGAGLIASYARPGGNVTGMATQFEDIVGKMLELLLEAVPQASPVAVLFNAGNRIHQRFLKELATAATPLQAILVPVPIGLEIDVDAAIDAAVRKGARSVLALPDDTVVGHLRREIIRAADKRRMPSFFGYREAVDDGALMSYGENRGRTYQRVAYYVDKLARGTRPEELPVEQPTRFELTVNQKTANALKLKIPQSILLRADHIVE